MSLIGAPLDRTDGPAKLMGTARYSGDFNLPRQLHAVMVLSTIAKGRIERIDTAIAAQSPGVALVMTHENAPRLPQGGRAGVHPPAGRVLALLQNDEVHYNREPIALVLAEQLEQAIAAATTLRVHYQPMAAQLDFAAGEAHAHSPGKVNGEDADSSRGDPQVAFSARMQATYTTPMEHHNPLEPHATLAHWEGDHLTVYDATQYISGVQDTLSKVLGIPKEQVHVSCPFVGGGFGCKGSMWSHVALAAMAAKRAGRPVKLVLDRSHMHGPVGGRPLTVQHFSLAASQEGRFLSTRHDVISHTSMIEDFTEPAALQTRILYDSQHVETSHRLVPLNVGTPTFQRAPGHATGTFALESAIDELAHELKVDPIELRLRNEPGIDPEKKLPWSSRALRPCFERGAAAFGWNRRQAVPGSIVQGSTAVGFGVATATYPANRSAASASARLTADGRAVFQSGTQDLGTGTYTVMTQIAADTLGFPVDRVLFELGDSAYPEAPVSGGSQSLASVGPAVQAAALALKEKIIALALIDARSPAKGATSEQVVIEEGQIGLRGRREREPVRALLARSGQRELTVSSKSTPGAEKKEYSMHSFGAVFVEAHVDRELGVIHVPRVVGRYSVGRLINEKTGRSQLMGGIVWGLGMALMEETVLDAKTGRILNANLADYHVPVNADIGEIDVDVVSENDLHFNPLGARGIGEIGITGVAAALANAIFNATGVRVRDLPITLDKVLKA